VLLVNRALAEANLPDFLPAAPSLSGFQVLSGAAAGLTANVAVLQRLRLKVTELQGPETAGVLNLKL